LVDRTSYESAAANRRALDDAIRDRHTSAAQFGGARLHSQDPTLSVNYNAGPELLGPKSLISSRLAVPGFRYGVYFALAMSLFFISVRKSPSPVQQPFGFVISDGRGYYAYLPSLVLDGDLDFTNQIREHWETDYSPTLLQMRTERGYVRNKYPVGVALTVAPAFLAGHVAACLLHPIFDRDSLKPDGYSAAYQLPSFLWITFLGIAAICLTDYLISNCFCISALPTFLATLVCWTGSPLVYYMTREPFMAHVASAFWVNLCLVQLYLISRKQPDGVITASRALLVTTAFAMALVCRPTNLFLAPFVVYALYRLATTGQFVRCLRLSPVAALGLAPLAAQSLVWHQMTGHWVHYSYGGAGFRWTQPALWQTLFSSRHGLFFWSPLLLAGVAGGTWRLVSSGRRPEPFVVCSLLSLVTLWYLNSSWHCWWFGDAFGARAFVEAGAIFAAGMAFLLERMRWSPGIVRLSGSFLLAAGVLGEIGLVGLYSYGYIPHDGYLFEGPRQANVAPKSAVTEKSSAAAVPGASTVPPESLSAMDGTEESDAGAGTGYKEPATSRTRAGGQGQNRPGRP
jgi:hypothetical protein